MASSSAASAGASPGISAASAGASTPGIGVATWNLGLNTADAFQKENKIAEILEATADTVAEMLLKVDIVSMNELHAQHQAQLNSYLSFHQGVRFMGFDIGDAVAWRPYYMQ